jgi:hypothetical protein
MASVTIIDAMSYHHNNANLPRYLDARGVSERIGLGYRALMQLVDRGLVRSIKLGPRAQSARLFRSSDVIDALDQMASGRTPRAHLRTPTGEAEAP